MANSASFSLLLKELLESVHDLTDFSKRTFDDLQFIRIKQNPPRYKKLCDNPRLCYLNLLDYKDKKIDFHSSLIGCISLYGRPTIFGVFGTSFRAFDEYTRANSFCFFVNYLKNMPNDSLDPRALDQRICHVVKKMEHCSNDARRLIFNTIMDLYQVSPTNKVVFPMVLKHLCNFEQILTYIARHVFTSYNAVFFKDFLDECVKSRSNFLTIWKRNVIFNNMPHCPMTYAYFQGKLDVLTVLLDYGFHHTDHRASTVEILLHKHSKLYKIPWLRHLVFPISQKPRNSLVLEVFLLIAAFYEPSRSPDDLAKCFRLAWDARKEPYVSRQELLNAFEDYMEVRDETQLWNTLEVLRFRFRRRLYDFKALLPDCQPLVPQPRSLQHLCRCTVREALNNNLELPHGVGKLPIPNKMKSYILLK